MATKKKVPAKKVPAKKAPAKKTTARSVAKVSPQRGMDVGSWVKAKAPGWMQDVTTRLISLVSKTVPSATVSIKWGRPVFDVNGPFAWVMPAKAHVTFGFWRGADLADKKSLLDGSGSRMRHLKIASAADVDEAVIVGFLREAAALNTKLGDPTKR